MATYIEVSGQVWVRTVLPDKGERWQRLVRAPSNPRNMLTLDALKEIGPIWKLEVSEDLTS